MKKYLLAVVGILVGLVFLYLFISVFSSYSELDKKVQKIGESDARQDSILAPCFSKKNVKIKQVVKKEFSTLEKRVESLENKFSDLEQENKSDHQAFARGFVELDSRTSQNSDDISGLKGKVAENSVRIGSLEKRVDSAEKEITTVRESIWKILGKEKLSKSSNDCQPGWLE